MLFGELEEKYDKMKKLISTKITKPWWSIDEENTLSYKVIKGFTDASGHLPKSIRKRAFSIIGKIAILSSRFFLVLNHVFLEVNILSGIEKNSGDKIKILFIGTNSPSPYILNLIFSKKPKIEKKSKISIFKIKKYINDIRNDVDAIFIKTDRFYSGFLEKQGYTIIPEWIRMTLDISEPFEKFYEKLSRSAKEDIRKIKKLDYTYEVSKDPEKLAFFYNKMYLPFVSSRFPKNEIVTNYYIMKHLFEQGSQILFIKYKDEYIFGGLFLKDKDTVTASYAGLMEGKHDHLKRGVYAASYYYLIEHSKKNNVNLINLGSCRPFVNDGLFWYKKKWGSEVVKYGNELSEIYCLKKCNENKAITSFLTNNPFIYLEKNELKNIANEQDIKPKK